MSPTHTNKGGARYRYYVSQSVLQGKLRPAGLVGRVPAAEIEGLVITALRKHLNATGSGEQLPDNDLELLERHLERVTLMPKHLELRLRPSVEPAPPDNQANKENSANRDSSAPLMANVTTITVPWASPVPAAVKGIIHVPSHNTPMKPSRRESLLMAIAQARSWVDELANGRVGSLAALARREGKAERHIRLLLPLAFVSPRIVSTILGGTAPAGLTITALAHALPWSWAEQERHLGLPGDQPAHLPNHTRLLS
jgi:site-specific DNA recombinase